MPHVIQAMFGFENDHLWNFKDDDGNEYNTCRDPMGGALDMDVEDMLDPEDYTIIPKDWPERPLPLRQRKEVQEVLRRKSVRFYRRRTASKTPLTMIEPQGDIAEA